MSAGSSGGTAINDEGRLIGIPTAGSELDCRAGDTNRDGTIEETDVGCIPVGGSLGLLVPVNDASDLLVRTGLSNLAAIAEQASASTAPTAVAMKFALTDGEVFQESCDDLGHRIANTYFGILDGRTNILMRVNGREYTPQDIRAMSEAERYELGQSVSRRTVRRPAPLPTPQAV
jgi:hypothetical protein